MLCVSVLPESTMMSSSSPEPSSSRNTTCLPWRNTVLLPEKPSIFCTFTIPSCRSWPSQCWCSSLGLILQGGGLGRRSGWRGMLKSSSGSSLMVRSLKETGSCGCEAEEWPCWTALSSSARCCLSFLLFFFLSLSAFLRSSGCNEDTECFGNKGCEHVRRCKRELTMI